MESCKYIGKSLKTKGAGLLLLHLRRKEKNLRRNMGVLSSRECF